MSTAVSVPVTAVQTAVQSNSVQKTDTGAKTPNSASFQSVLGKAVASTTNTQTSGATDTAKDIVSKIVDKLNSGASTEEIAKMLSGMTDDQTDALAQLVQKLLAIISDAISSEKQGVSSNEKLSSALSDLIKQSDDDKTSSDMLQLLMAMLFGNTTPDTTADTQAKSDTQQNVTAIGADAVTINVKNPSKSDLEAIVKFLAEKVAEDITNQLAQTQQSTDSTAKTATTPVAQTADTTPAFTSKLDNLMNMAEKLTKLSQAISQKINAEAETKVVSSTMASGDTGVKMAAESQTAKLATLTNKVVKNNSEFDEILAASQTIKPQAVSTEQTQTVTQPTAIPVEKQVSDAVLNQLTAKVDANNVQEMTLKLNPKELGEVSIKLVKAGGEITISIAAQNVTTQKLLQDKLPTLVSNLQATNSEVKDVQIVNPNQNASAFMSGFSLSDSNAHSQYKSDHSQSSVSYDQSQPQEDIQQPQEFVREGALWQTA